jgi:RNA polymerase sigma-70 factor (ECF subfamily)
VSSRQEAEDVTQEVFLRALRRLPETASGWDSIRPYLAIVAQNLLRDRWRQSARVRRVDADLDSFEAPESGPEETALATEQRSLLVVSLARLPVLYQHVLRLRLLEGRSATEVGVVLGRNPEAVRQLQHRALVALRSELADQEREFGHD